MPTSSLSPVSSSSTSAAAAPSFWQSRAGLELKEWFVRLAVKVGTYAVLLLGVYWVAAAWFSTWGFEGKSLAGTIFWTLVGDALIALGWYSTSPESEPAHAKPGDKRPLSAEERRKVAETNLRLGALWLAGGIVGTIFVFTLKDPGMFYVPAAGALAYGGVQVGIGLLERYAGDELAKLLKLR
jgi:hypothetical protein